MNTYKQSEDLSPFLLTRDDLIELWDLVQTSLPAGELFRDWCNVSASFESVSVSEPNVDDFLNNPALPDVFDNLSITVSRYLGSMNEPAHTIRGVRLRRGA